MEDKIKIFFQASVSAILIVLGLFLVGCKGLEAVTIGDKTYVFGESKDREDQDKAAEISSESNQVKIESKDQKVADKATETSSESSKVKIEPADQRVEVKPAETLSGSDKVRNELISGLETAISTMENWDNIAPEKRQSVINSLKELASQNR